MSGFGLWTCSISWMLFGLPIFLLPFVYHWLIGMLLVSRPRLMEEQGTYGDLCIEQNFHWIFLSPSWSYDYTNYSYFNKCQDLWKYYLFILNLLRMCSLFDDLELSSLQVIGDVSSLLVLVFWSEMIWESIFRIHIMLLWLAFSKISGWFLFWPSLLEFLFVLPIIGFMVLWSRSK